MTPSTGWNTAVPQWTELDEVLWHTCAIVSDSVDGKLRARPPIASLVALPPDEQVLATGNATRLVFSAPGDGTYRHSSVALFGSPAFVVGGLAANAMLNSARRNRAAQDAVRRWLPDAGGHITITDRRFVFHPPGRPGNSVHFSAATVTDLAGPDLFYLQFPTDDGRVLDLQFHTPWAALLLVLTGVWSNPRHPRLLDGSWLPAGWAARCAPTGRPLRDAPTALAQLCAENLRVGARGLPG